MNTTVYIRKSNEDKWNSIEDKSKWVNERLDDALRSPGISVKVEEVLANKLLPVQKKNNICKQHQVDKSVCRYMKHD